MKRSKPLRRTKPLVRKTAMPRNRPRMKRQRRPGLRKADRDAVFDRAAGRCERCSTRITRETGQFHHRKLRSRGGDDSPANCVALCPACHEWVHANPRLATVTGWMVPSWADPAKIPVQPLQGADR